MKLVRVDLLHADGGWRTLSFLKLTTDAGLIGWSEFSESAIAPGLSAAVEKLARSLVGEDPRHSNRLLARLRAPTRMHPGGVLTMAIGAVENALVDLRAKALGVPVHALFGGAHASQLEVYWSQCATLRTERAAQLGVAPIASLADIEAQGREVADRGYRALKTNLLRFEPGQPRNYRPGFGSGAAHPTLNVEPGLTDQVLDLLDAFERGAGPAVALMLDLNANLRPEGIHELCRALPPRRLQWLEMDLRSPDDLLAVRRRAPVPLASLETVLGRGALKPFLDRGCVDVAIIDPQWNGIVESLAMAQLAEACDVNVASHNYHGPLATLIGAHFSAVIPNNRIVEYVVDEPPWVAGFVTCPIEIVAGRLVLPDGPGWGADINEAVVAQYPARLD